jgi:NADH dehydrogenase [ubiquinone] 1 alpha subcomplex assembly factor 7
MEAALYDSDGGFFALGGGAGTAGADFLTSAEVGPLFGTLVGRALDRWWERLGCPDPYLVIDAGAGRGQLAGDVLRAAPACAPALRYVLVERSAALREAQAGHLALEPAALALGPAVVLEPDEPAVPVPGVGPVLTALADLPATRLPGVVVANELLDNLPVRLVERGEDAWREVRVGEAPAGDASRFAEVLVPAPPDLAAEAEALAGGLDLAPGTRLPVHLALAGWLRDAGATLTRGALVVLDYADTVAGLAARGQGEWLRTYRAQRRGGSPLEDPGSSDITCDVAVEAVRRGAAAAGLEVAEETTQADWLVSLGLDELVAEGRAAWHGRTATDLAALAARSRVGEAEALGDPAGLGAHRVFVLVKA